MDNLLTICLEAHHHRKNHHRAYRITVGRDLFGDWTVCIRYGRTGQHGAEHRFGSPDECAMQAVIQQQLKRRLSARKRIGCDYRITAIDVCGTLDRAAWLRSELIDRF